MKQSRESSNLKAKFALNPTITFLNHGSYGATPKQLQQQQQYFRTQLESNPVNFFNRSLPDMITKVQSVVANYVGASDATGIVLLPNVTTALNAIARSIQLNPGDEILLSNHEYGAMRLLWEEIASIRQARIVVTSIPIPINGEQEIITAFESAITSRTRVLFFSHITSLSAIIFPAKSLCNLARQAGAISIVDGAHVPGHIPLKLDELQPDCYAGNMHKWLCAPKSSAFLYASPSVRQWLGGDVVSWGWTWDNDDAYQSRFRWRGTVDPSAMLCIPDAIKFQEINNWDTVRLRARSLAEETLTELETRYCAFPVANTILRPPQMLSLILPKYKTGPPAESIQKQLWSKYSIEIPVEAFLGHTIIRLSLQGYNSKADCEHLILALGEIIHI
jgi:isopenicillin-N epimerase